MPEPEAVQVVLACHTEYWLLAVPHHLTAAGRSTVLRTIHTTSSLDGEIHVHVSGLHVPSPLVLS